MFVFPRRSGVGELRSPPSTESSRPAQRRRTLIISLGTENMSRVLPKPPQLTGLLKVFIVLLDIESMMEYNLLNSLQGCPWLSGLYDDDLSNTKTRT